jgi:hypothetical protein
VPTAILAQLNGTRVKYKKQQKNILKAALFSLAHLGIRVGLSAAREQ